MDYKIFSWITTTLLFGSWLYIAYSAYRAYQRVRKSRGVAAVVTKPDLRRFRDPFVLDEITRWRRSVRNLVLIWLATLVLFFILSIVIEHTIGFTNR